jgi:hypothetical protein
MAENVQRKAEPRQLLLTRESNPYSIFLYILQSGSRQPEYFVVCLFYNFIERKSGRD